MALPGKPGAIVVAALLMIGHAIAHAHDIDPTRLPLGDGKISNTPRPGWIWACRVDPNAGGAFRDGLWIRRDGTWDSTAKIAVGGSVASAASC